LLLVLNSENYNTNYNKMFSFWNQDKQNTDQQNTEDTSLVPSLADLKKLKLKEPELFIKVNSTDGQDQPNIVDQLKTFDFGTLRASTSDHPQQKPKKRKVNTVSVELDEIRKRILKIEEPMGYVSTGAHILDLEKNITELDDEIISLKSANIHLIAEVNDIREKLNGLMKTLSEVLEYNSMDTIERGESDCTPPPPDHLYKTGTSMPVPEYFALDPSAYVTETTHKYKEC
jgi:hypothetical protein